MNFWALLADIGLLLGGCIVFGSIALRLKLSPLIGYLAAGMILGPRSLKLISSQTYIETIAELGVSLFLFSLGLEFSWSRLKGFDRSAIWGAALQVTLTPFLFLGAAQLLGVDFRVGLTFGLMFTLSSTASVLRTLSDQGEVDSAHGRNAMSILLIQDIAVIPFALTITMLANQASTNTGVLREVLSTVGGALVLVFALYILLSKFAVRALGTLTLEQNREMSMVLTTVAGIGSAWGAHAVGLSPAMGAFIAGMFLGGSPFATQIRTDISSLGVVLLTLFFGAAGMIADPVWIVQEAWWLLAFCLLLLMAKSILTSLLFTIVRTPPAVAIATGICVSQVGEFAFVLGSIAYSSGLIDGELYQLAVSVTIITLLCSPFLVNQASPIGRTLARRFLSDTPERIVRAPDATGDKKCFILGFGPAGEAVARRLGELGESVIAMDLNRNSLARAQACGIRCFIGDAQQASVLNHYGINGAKLVVITFPSREAVQHALQHVRKLAPQAVVLVRARYQLHKKSYLEHGAHYVVSDEETVGRSLAEIAAAEVQPVQNESMDRALQEKERGTPSQGLPNPITKPFP